MTPEQEKRLEVIGAFYGRDAEEDTAFIAELLAMVDSLREELACKTDDAFFSVPALRAQVEKLIEAGNGLEAATRMSDLCHEEIQAARDAWDAALGTPSKTEET